MKGKHTSLKYLLTLIIFFLLTNLHASEKDWQIAAEGNKIILIRHSIAPGGGDPEGFNLRDCKTQRNLSIEGIKQSKKIGELFKEKKVPIDKVLSSEWCRCKDTAYYAFGTYKIFKPLNSTFTPPFNSNEEKQVREIKNYVRKWESKNKNLILVTHYSIINALTNSFPSSGELILINRKFKVLGRIKTN